MCKIGHMSKQVNVMRTYKIPLSLEKTFDKSIKPMGLFSNYPDFLRDAVREKLEREIN